MNAKTKIRLDSIEQAHRALEALPEHRPEELTKTQAVQKLIAPIRATQNGFIRGGEQNSVREQNYRASRPWQRLHNLIAVAHDPNSSWPSRPFATRIQTAPELCLPA